MEDAMKNLFGRQGRLAVSVGEGSISSFESSALRTGDVVSSSKIAGFPATVFFNEQFMCHCEVVIFTDLFGVRVTNMVRANDSQIESGIKDEAIELLPFRIILGSINVTLEQLRGVEPGTAVSLGVPYNEEIDATLEIAGFPVASGKVVCIYENIGIRLVDIYENAFPKTSIRTTGNVYESEYATSSIKDYSFKRPDKFSRDAIDRLRGIHGLFAKNLNTMSAHSNARVTAVDQLAFGEALDGFCSDRVSFVVLKNSRFTPSPNAKSSAPETLLVEEEGTQYSVSDGSKALLRKMIPADGRVFGKPVFACYTRDKSIGEMMSTAEGLASTIACLRGAWKNLADLNLDIDSQSTSDEDIRIISDNELVVAIELSNSGGSDDRILLIYPYITLEPFIRILN
jgi:flagellar motor switch protein FliM